MGAQPIAAEDFRWSLEEMETEQIRTGPRNLASLLRPVQDGHPPDPDTDTDVGF